MGIEGLQKPYFTVFLRGVTFYVIPSEDNQVRSYGLQVLWQPPVPPVIEPGQTVAGVPYEMVQEAISQLHPRTWG